MPARRPLQLLAEDRNTDFIRRFTQREEQRRVAKRPVAFTPNQRAALRKQLEDTEFLQPDYADKTKINIAANRAMAMDFLEYLCQTHRIYSWGSSWEYFRQYKQLYASVTGRYMDRNDSREIHLLVLLTFNIKYNTGIFSWVRHRFNPSGCYLGLAFTGARPAEFVDGERKAGKDATRARCPDEHSKLLEEMLLQECESRGRPKALCYEDILLMVVRHPETGEDILATSIKFVHHKGADNMPKPTIFFFAPARRLIFCFITVIVSLPNRGPVKCTPLRWKEEWLKRPVFRRHEDSVGDSDERKYQPLLYQKLHDDMERQSLDAGEENAIEPKAWRRGAANVANGNGSDAVRDQMVRHDPKWATFNSAYINEKVGFHLQNAFLDEATEDSLLAMLSHIGLMRDPRASKDMVPNDVWEMMPPDTEIERLEVEKAQLKGGQYRIKGSEHEDRIRELTRSIATKVARRKNDIRRAYWEDYFYNRPTWDIEAKGQEEKEYGEPAIDLCIPERAQLAEILCNQPDNSSSTELLELRILAAELMVALCGKRETVKRNRIQRRARADVKVKEESRAKSFPAPNG
ncbi:FluG domain-containing protein [Podospora fimiseda]|uniref:FluG domain-containing protein n=1 Tax=Podospora fimiseda TaxID=252190 RepID=A0AAN7BQA2_9PEZI|nr:FluG domain-containing protein [Podospora fimiseda]